MPGTLPSKSQALVEAGLPWPDQPYSHNETRLLCEKNYIPWNQGKDVRDSYHIDTPLGTGGFAKVYKGRAISDGRDVAIKHICIQNEDDREIVYREIKHLVVLLGIRQVVTIYEVFESGSDVYIAMELCKGGELLNTKTGSDGKPLTYGDVGRIAVCMLVLADGMHQHGVVHCDLKPENLCLVEPLGTPGIDLVDSLRLIDFGLSQRVRGGQAIAGLAGSIPFMAPEVKTQMYDSKVDIWSIGVIIYTLLVGKLPFEGASADMILFAAATQEPDVSGLHPAVADLVKWLLTKDPRKRPTAREALTHPWLESIDKKTEGDAMAQCVSNEVLQNLSLFAASNKLQRIFMHLAVNFLNQSEMTRILASFQALTIDHNQELSTEEMAALLTKDKDKEKAKRIRHTIELVMGKNGALSLDDFVVASMNQYRNLTETVIRTMFTRLDSNGNGWITAEDAWKALQPTGINVTIEELAELFEKYGSKKVLGSNKGMMSFKDFSQLMLPSVSQRFAHELDCIVTAFKHYDSQNHFQKLARRIVANHAPMTREFRIIRKCFEMLDVSKSNAISFEEFAKGIRQAGYVVSDEELEKLFKSLDTDGTKLVRYEEFVAGALDHELLVSEPVLRWLFEFMDDDNTKSINTQNFKNLIDQMDWTEQEKARLFAEVRNPGTNEVDLKYEDFYRLMTEICDHEDGVNGSSPSKTLQRLKSERGEDAATDDPGSPLLLRSAHSSRADLRRMSTSPSLGRISQAPSLGRPSSFALATGPARSTPGATAGSPPKDAPSSSPKGSPTTHVDMGRSTCASSRESPFEKRGMPASPVVKGSEAWKQPSSITGKKGRAGPKRKKGLFSCFGSPAVT